ncbi:MAG: hypothetical protein CMB49_05835 [Euryarchaeota archaeon]|nr:hypothetical protein [Euryarchaeota archaeon]
MLIISRETLAISIGAPISLCGLVMFVWGMSLQSQELGWSEEKIAKWAPSTEEMTDAGRIMYRVDTTLDEPYKSTILCGSCGEVTAVDGKRPKHFTCPSCENELWEEE